MVNPEYSKLSEHWGHVIDIASYPGQMVVECTTCQAVLVTAEYEIPNWDPHID